MNPKHEIQIRMYANSQKRSTRFLPGPFLSLLELLRGEDGGERRVNFQSSNLVRHTGADEGCCRLSSVPHDYAIPATRLFECLTEESE